MPYLSSASQMPRYSDCFLVGWSDEVASSSGVALYKHGTPYVGLNLHWFIPFSCVPQLTFPPRIIIMKFFWNVIFSLLIANCYVVSAAELPNRGCGSHMSDEEVDTFERSFTSEIEKATPVESANKPSSYIVLVYWHVIAAGKSELNPLAQQIHRL